MHTSKKTADSSAVSTEPAPLVHKTKRRVLTPSVMAPFLAAAVQDVTPPAPQVSVTPTVPSSGTASATAPLTGVQSIATGAVPVVTSPTTASSPVVAAPAGASTLPGVVSPPPDGDIPSVPAGFVVPNYRDFLGFRPSSRELGAASAVIADLQRFSDYPTVLGSAAPPAAAIAAALTLGTEWRAMRDTTESWDEYAKAQDAMAWKNALTLLDELKPLFLNAVAKNATLAQQYLGLAQMFDAQRAPARQAAVTKKRNAKAKADTAAPAAQAAAAAAPSAVPVATAAAAPATAGKTITVGA